MKTANSIQRNSIKTIIRPKLNRQIKNRRQQLSQNTVLHLTFCLFYSNLLNTNYK